MFAKGSNYRVQILEKTVIDHSLKLYDFLMAIFNSSQSLSSSIILTLKTRIDAQSLHFSHMYEEETKHAPATHTHSGF